LAVRKAEYSRPVISGEQASLPAGKP
jgi:hypothetical protein